MNNTTRFSQLMKHFPKDIFQNIIEQEKADKYVKSFTTKNLLDVMLYAQITQSKSLRRVVDGFNSHANSHYHLGCQKIKRSTFSEALSKRNLEPFKQICEVLMKTLSSKRKRECNEFISIIDSSPIMLKGHGYEWALDHKTHRMTGLKIHVEIDGADNAPSYVSITPANVCDITDVKDQLPLRKNTTYVMDKGYTDYNWWRRINDQESYFVTRCKSNMAKKVIKSQTVPSQSSQLIKSDQLIHLTNKSPRGGKINQYAGKDLRLVTVFREDKKPMDIITNDFDRTAEEIADLYKQRWQIELFFKWIKQKLKLKKYLGFSENAVKIQIYTALISYLLMQLLKNASEKWSTMLEVQTWLQHGLFIKDSLNRWHYRRKRKQQMLIDRVQMSLNFP